MSCATKREYALCGLNYRVYFKLVAVKHNCSCNPGGVSPSMHKDVSCLTGPLLTGWAVTYCSHCGLTSPKSMRHSRCSPRRVEWPSTKCSTNSFLYHCRQLCFLCNNCRNFQFYIGPSYFGPSCSEHYYFARHFDRHFFLWSLILQVCLQNFRRNNCLIADNTCG